jgi:hypothetical protein
MSGSTLTRKRIDVTIQLGTGAFGEGGENTVTVSGLRVHAQILKAGGSSMGEAQLQIFGLTRSLLNQLSALTTVIMMQRKNIVTVSAGDDVTGMATVFKGTIAEGWADLNSAPDAILHIKAYAGLFQKLTPVPPSSFPGPVNAADVMAALARQMGLGFEANGVSVILPKPYLPGTAWEQARKCAEQAGIEWTIEDDILAIWPKGASRVGDVVLVSPETGLVGYPAFNGVGVSVRTAFDRRLHYGRTAQVQSSIQNACGNWYIASVSHELQSETPGGLWFTNFQGNPLDNIYALAKPQ